MGLQMQAMALGWEVYERTNDVKSLGYVGLCRVLPVLLLALPAGQLIDMLSRKKVLIWTQIAFAMVSLLIAAACFLKWPTGWLYILVILSGCARVFNGPVRSSLLPQLVPQNVFQNAVTWNSGVFHLSAMLGPIAGGMLIERAVHWGPAFSGTSAAAPVYALAALSCMTFAISAIFMKPRPNDFVSAPPKFSTLAAGILDGARFVWRDKIVLGALALDLLAVLIGGATGLLPVIAKDVLKVGAAELGYLTAAPYAGAVLMAFVLAHRRPFERTGHTLLWAVAGFGLATIMFGFSKWLWISIGLLFVAGALDNISVVIRHALVPLRTPNALRGRVSAVNSVFIESSNELGKMSSTGVADILRFFASLRGLDRPDALVFGAVGSIISGGVGTILIVLWIGRAFPELRTLGRIEAAAAPERSAATDPPIAPDAPSSTPTTTASSSPP